MELTDLERGVRKPSAKVRAQAKMSEKEQMEAAVEASMASPGRSCSYVHSYRMSSGPSQSKIPTAKLLLLLSKSKNVGFTLHI